MTTVSIAEGLVFVIDEVSVIHCLDADTGKKYWTYALKGDHGQLNTGMVAVDGKLYAAKTILAVSKTLTVLGTIDDKKPDGCSTPCVANNVLFTVHGKMLVAVCDKGDKVPAADAKPPQ